MEQQKNYNRNNNKSRSSKEIISDRTEHMLEIAGGFDSQNVINIQPEEETMEDFNPVSHKLAASPIKLLEPSSIEEIPNQYALKDYSDPFF